MDRPIVVDGATVGRWSRALSKREVVVEATLFAQPDAHIERALQGVVDRFGVFLGLSATLRTLRAP
jgi:hypothetical protein